MKKKLPTNSVSQSTLHTAILRCVSFHKETSKSEMSKAAMEIANWSATLAAILNDIAHEFKADPAYNHVFEGAEGWRFEWQDVPHALHTAVGLFYLSVGQQVILIPQEYGGGSVGTYRFRLRLGDPKSPPFHRTSLAELRPHAVSYLDKYKDVLPASQVDILSHIFGGEGTHGGV